MKTTVFNVLQLQRQKVPIHGTTHEAGLGPELKMHRISLSCTGIGWRLQGYESVKITRCVKLIKINTGYICSIHSKFVES